MSAKTKTEKTSKKSLNKKIIQSTNLLTNESGTGAEEREVMLGGGAGGDEVAEVADEKETPTAAKREEESVLDEASLERGVARGDVEQRWGGWWHKINVSYPWLKFVLFVALAVGVLFGGYGVARVVHEMSAQGEGASSEVEGDNQENSASNGELVSDPKDQEEKPEASENGTRETGGGGGTEGNGDSEGGIATPPTSSASSTPAAPVSVPEGAAGKRLIALTFDDGPSAATTARLLDILKAKNVKVTFFVLGQRMQQLPDLVKREAAEGHEVASHTPYHNQQTKLSAANIQAEAATMNQLFTEILGHNPPFTRPPYGAVNDTVRQFLGQPLILWSVDPEDWKDRNAATVRSRVVGAAYDGAIVLMHDIHATTVDAVAGIIDDLRAQGYEFLTVSELAAARGTALQNGWSYYYFKP